MSAGFHPLRFISFGILAIVFLASGTTAPSRALAAMPLPAPEVEQIRTLTLQGWNSAYNLDLAKANAFFEQASRVEPLHPRPYLGKAMIVFWRYLLNRKEADKESFLAIAESTIVAGEKYEETYGEDAELKLCLGTIYGYRSFLYGRSRSYFKGAWDGKKSYDYFCDALRLDPKMYDAYLGIGLFHYFTTFIPKPLQWVVSVMGITGDSELGMKEIRAAAQRGVFMKTEAQYYLAQFLPWHEGDFDASETILKSLHGEFPGNTLVSFTLSVWEMKRSDMASAGNRLAELVHSAGEDHIGIRTIASYKLGECLFRQNEFSRSRVEYQRFTSAYREHTYSATANFRIGWCFEIAGNRDSALVYYKKASDGEHRFGDDAYCARKAARFLQSSPSTVDSLILLAQNAQKSGNTAEAKRLFTIVGAMPDGGNDARVEALFGVGETLADKKSYAEALPYFREVVGLTVRSELWLKPWAHYYSGICLSKTGDALQAKKEFNNVAEYDEYDFKNWLDFRSKRELEKLDQ